ncbi:MAG: type III-A CRISPR-associated RAMP protein Csm3 [Candidatus Omnitrophica bacterium]|nr:type III-A CRISPR-associated RAMP protein Csm3 [Candidatus Omnitrophota bacterium]
MELLKYYTLKGKIEVLTGLHIGAGSEIIEIGGMDNPVIKHPITKEPYIPGSSLKGKIRALLEWYEGKVNDKGDVHSCDKTENAKNCHICRIFGVSASEKLEIPTRVIFRDCFLNEEWKKKIFERELELVEEKRENTINRISSVANPRSMERVPPGAIFDFELNYRIFNTKIDNENFDNGKIDEEFFSTLLTGLKLLEMDYLGGSGTRGYGKIKFIKELMLDKGDGPKDILDDFDKIKLNKNIEEKKS